MKLHPQLEQDCIVLGKFQLCRLLLMNDAQYPWCILVPERDSITEIYQLSTADQQLLCHESSLLAAGLMAIYKGDKMNIAALGNVVPQLHIHHVVRFRTDPVWPAPIWGKLPAQPYDKATLTTTLHALQKQFANKLTWFHEH